MPSSAPLTMVMNAYVYECSCSGKTSVYFLICVTQRAEAVSQMFG